MSRGRGREHEYEITEEWLRDVRAALGPKRGAQAKLARDVGCSPGTITVMLRGGKRSHLVPRISKVLNVPMPRGSMALTADALEIATLVQNAGESGRRALSALMRAPQSDVDIVLQLLEQLSQRK
jgi:hypothetical protein